MSCACENKKYSQDLERIRNLAKAYAKLEGVTVSILKRKDGTYYFEAVSQENKTNIIEFITPY